MSFYGQPQHWQTIPNRQADEDAINSNFIRFCVFVYFRNSPFSVFSCRL